MKGSVRRLEVKSFFQNSMALTEEGNDFLQLPSPTNARTPTISRDEENLNKHNK